MDLGELLQRIRHELELLRAEYVASGRGDEFDRQVAALRAQGLYPFAE